MVESGEKSGLDVAKAERINSNIAGAFFMDISESFLTKLKQCDIVEIRKAITKQSKKGEGLLEKKIEPSENILNAADSREDRNYIRHFLKQQSRMLDYSKLFSYLGNRKDNVQVYDAYSVGAMKDIIQDYSEAETISVEAVDRIIEDKVMEDIFGFDNSRATVEEKEAFKHYKIFNKALIELKYSMAFS